LPIIDLYYLHMSRIRA